MKRLAKEYAMNTPRVFLWDAKWASGDFATDALVSDLVEALKKLDYTKPLTETIAVDIETSINTLALTILRYSASEWGNDYWYAATKLGDIMRWYEKYSKHHKIGRYFSP